MNMQLRLSLIQLAISSCLLAVALAAPGRSPILNDETANRYFDLVIKRLGSHVRKNNMDPLPIGDQVIGFSKTMGWVTMSGRMGITDGRIYGLSKMYRAGDCSIESQGNKLIVGTEIVLRNLRGATKGHVEFMGHRVDADLNVAVESVIVDARISMGSGSVPELEKFSISSMSGITVQFRGLGPLNWIINHVSSKLVKVVRNELINAINSDLVRLINMQTVLQSVTLPL